MMKSCMYCKTNLNDDSVFDVCQPCGHGVWGKNMYNAILQNMGQAKEAGDLYQGAVSSPVKEKKKLVPFESQHRPIVQESTSSPQAEPALVHEPTPQHLIEPIIQPNPPSQPEFLTPIKDSFGPDQESILLPPEEPQLFSDSGDLLF